MLQGFSFRIISLYAIVYANVLWQFVLANVHRLCSSLQSAHPTEMHGISRENFCPDRCHTQNRTQILSAATEHKHRNTQKRNIEATKLNVNRLRESHVFVCVCLCICLAISYAHESHRLNAGRPLAGTEVKFDQVKIVIGVGWSQRGKQPEAFLFLFLRGEDGKEELIFNGSHHVLFYVLYKSV